MKSQEYHTIYYNPRIPVKTLTESQRTIYQTEFRRIYGKLFPEKTCYNKGLEPQALYTSLGLHQLQFVFFLVLVLPTTIGTIIALGEAIAAISKSWACDTHKPSIIETYEDGYRACVMELLQLIAGNASIDEIAEHFQRVIQQQSSDTELNDTGTQQRDEIDY